MSEKMTASDKLAQINDLKLSDIHSLGSIDPRFIMSTTYLQLTGIINEIEEEAGMKITTEPLPELTHSRNEASEALKDIMFFRTGQIHLIRGVIKGHQVETLGQVIAVIRSLDQIANTE